MANATSDNVRFAKLILALAFVLFATGTPLVKWLTLNSSNLGLNGKSAISFCNLLFVGNIFSATVSLIYYRPNSIWLGFRSANLRARGLLLLCALLAIMTPMLLVMAIQRTSATNVILISRLGPILYAIVSTTLDKKRIHYLTWIGYSVIFGSILLASFVGNSRGLETGDILALVASVTYCIAAMANKKGIRVVGESTFVFTRNFISAIVFAAIAIGMFGWHHFMELIHPQLWVVLSVYALLAVAGAQLAWFYALDRVEPLSVGNLSVLAPIAGFAFAYLLLAEYPNRVQAIAILLVIAGVLIGNAGKNRQLRGHHESPEFSLSGN